MLIWVADYGKTSLHQYNEDGTENKYGDIDRGALKRFILCDDDKVRFVLNLDSGKKLIYRRRVAMNMNSNVCERVYIIGYQEGQTQCINFYFESTGHIETIDGFKEGHEWFYPVVLLPDEK